MHVRTLVVVVVAAILIWWTSSLASKQPNDVAKFMRAKLTHSQKVLEGLTTGDFDMIAKNAQEMSLLSQAASWQVLQTMEYRERSAEFRRSVEAITEAAKKDNLDGAALAYVDVTLKCVNCHKYVRTVRIAKLEQPAATTQAQLANAH